VENKQILEPIEYSVIVPFDNRFELVEELIGVWTKQKKQAGYTSELILVFDGTEDQLRMSDFFLQTKSIQDSKLLFTQGKLGPGFARNLGISQAIGDYLIFLDSDDLLESDFFKKITDFLRHGNIWPDVISFDWTIFPEPFGNKLPRKDYRWLSNSCLAIEQFTKHHLEASVIFSTYRRSFIEENNILFPIKGIHEDIFFHAQALFKAKEISYLNNSLYIKRDFNDGLTKTWNQSRVEDYLNAYLKVTELCSEVHSCGKVHDEFISRTIPSAIASLCLKVSRIEKTNAIDLLDFIKQKFWKPNFGRALPSSTAYARVLKALEDNAKSSLARIEEISQRSLSCKDLHRSLYLAPNEIRTCCKRFFVNGEIRGDVRIFRNNPIEGDKISSINEKDIRLAKRDLFTDLNYGEVSDCDGCPFIEASNWDNLEDKLDIQLLSMEQHSICNLRCTYCDETYYGGLRENYDLPGLLKDLSNRGAFDNLELAVWGGGEPVLDPMFSKYVGVVSSKTKHIVHRFLSNSLRHSKTISDSISQENGLLVTSIDAGNEETYRKVRGRTGYEKVWQNLKKYSEGKPDRITIKYIFTLGNCDLLNIEGFIRSVSEYGLQGCFFQISSDFKREHLDEELVELILTLYSRLLEIGVEFVYLDDLIWQRWSLESRLKLGSLILVGSGGSGWTASLANPKSVNNVLFWGSGQLSNLLLSNKDFQERWKVRAILDSDSKKWGRRVHGIEVCNPLEFSGVDCKVFLSGIQSIHNLYKSLPLFGFHQESIMQKIIW
jgi:glycosyltransferase involved in cell wall biosynthesis